MDEETNTNYTEVNEAETTDYRPVNRFDASAVHHLSGMYQNWFLDYASSVILDRAVPHIEDGLKPVQRRILHSMKRMDDGRFNKVANIVGHTMQFHPHGDASIGDALVQLGQKDLLVDTQGNWGNILTGSSAAAPRYIEARLSKFALETVFNPKTTEWQMSYDGRNKEPVMLPAKYPLLLAQGAEGIAVGLNCKIMPHNFCEICDAAIAYLRGEEFHLYPDFPTGGSVDVSKYNDGKRGGSIKVRAKIEKIDQKTLVIRDIPFSKTSETLIESITKAVDKNKIKVRKIEDLTAANVEILIHLMPGVSSDKTIDALYAFTDCEISISPNCCVIKDKKPQFLTVSDVLKSSAQQTMSLLKQELEIRRQELLEQLFFCSLEKIFIEERIYKDKKYENATSMDAACEHIDDRLTPYYPHLVREVTKDDILRLMEIKMKRILKFSKDQAEDLIKRIEGEIAEIERDLGRIVDVTCEWFEHLKEKYGAEHPRLTEIRNFDTIEATKVAEANKKLYIDRHEGFIGIGLKKAEYVCNCSDIDDIIIFYRDGKYKITRVAEKIDVGKNVLHLQVWKKGDKRTIYNCVYRDGRQGRYYVKRFFVDASTRDREYDITQGTPGSRVIYFTANPNGEAEVIKVTLEPGPKIKRIFFDYDFSVLDIKGRSSKGNILSKSPVHKIGLKSHGRSTLGGREIWWDADVNRLNYDQHGVSLGKFGEGDQLLVVLSNGDFYITTADTANHFENNILRIEKWDAQKPWTAVVIDADNNRHAYIKRFEMDAIKNHRNFVGENPDSQLLILSDVAFPRIQVTFGGADSFREPLEIDCEEFVAVKGFKAKGKRISTFAIDSVAELDPLRFPEVSENTDENDGSSSEEEENLDPDAGKSQQDVLDELTGQLNLFD
ncbi:MAG: DNA gyrase/topoisomerase IV subunit A [Prevotella sp.]|nr:DNA gyrase/topoisomerase IV subunit A [Prevotella sp.]